MPAHLLLQQFFVAQRPLQLGVLGHVAPICSQACGGSNSRTHIPCTCLCSSEHTPASLEEHPVEDAPDKGHIFDCHSRLRALLRNCSDVVLLHPPVLRMLPGPRPLLKQYSTHRSRKRCA